MKLVLASGNQHKLEEFRDLLGSAVQITDFAFIPMAPLPAESGSTFEQNAIIKAVHVSKGTADFVLADDSGLEVDALEGAPGIFSARYAGTNATDQQNVAKLLRELENGGNRSARFRCVIALARNGALIGTFEGKVAGKITENLRGRNGFGYDPVFQPDGFNQTFAEMSAKQKNRISHRAKAIAALRRKLRELQS